MRVNMKGNIGDLENTENTRNMNNSYHYVYNEQWKKIMLYEKTYHKNEEFLYQIHDTMN